MCPSRTILLLFAGVLGALSSSGALAQSADALKAVNLRAGPARDYPLVAQVPQGTPLEVAGCLQDYTWCDVTTGPLRGWVYARNLGIAYQDQSVPILGYGARLELPIVTFSLGAYWDEHYRGRPWFGDRARYLSRPAPGPRQAAPARPIPDHADSGRRPPEGPRKLPSPRAVREPAERPAEHPAERPAERPAEHQAERPAEAGGRNEGHER